MNILLNGEKLGKEGCMLWPFLFNIVLELPAMEKKDIWIRKKVVKLSQAAGVMTLNTENPK